VIHEEEKHFERRLLLRELEEKYKNMAPIYIC